MGKIAILPDNIINLIAAGEVVERPASVVKELMENAVDAGSTSIVVKVSQAGTAGISISDDGIGMDDADARLAFRQHATSKIKTAGDLEDIHSLGFRGEALASISAVARIEVETKTVTDDPVKLSIYKDSVVSAPAARSDRGTTISITRLFDDLPARKKFLKSEPTEFGYIQTTFISIALVNLGIHFELYHNAKLVYRLPAATGFADRVFSIWDAKTAEQLYPLETEQGAIRLRAYVGSPDIARGDRKLQYLFVNGRSVSDRLLSKAVSEAYQGFIHRDLQPVYFVILDMPGEMVDVNVHPRKLEVRFRDGGTVFNMVRSLIRQHLERSTRDELIARVQTPGAEQHNWSPRPAQQSYHRQSAAPPMPSMRPLDLSTGVYTPSRPELSAEPATADGGYLQLFATYITYQQGSDVVFVDQHAAAEKILYERLSASLDTNRSKPLLIPEIVELDQAAKSKVLELKSDLAAAGIELQDFGGDSVQITAIPEVIPSLDTTNFLRSIVQSESESGALPMRDDIKHYILATMACHGAIRAGQPLSQPEMQQLIYDLSQCQQPYNCPHGRPVSWILSRYDLEKGFKRVI